MRNRFLINEVVGEKIKFMIVPHIRGEGFIRSMQTREMYFSHFDPKHGDVDVSFDVFDIEVRVSEGLEANKYNCAGACFDSEQSLDLAETTIKINNLTMVDLVSAIKNQTVLYRAPCS